MDFKKDVSPFEEGFLSAEYKSADAAFRSAITQWHMWHLGNTGFTEHNLVLIVNRIKGICEEFYGPLPKKKIKNE